MSSIDDILERAVRHEAHFAGPRTKIPTSHLAIVTCMDSRIDALRIFGLEAGEAHVLRNAGGLASDDVLRSLVLSQRLLQTREIVLMHHTQCGVHGADEPKLRAELLAETGSVPAYDFGGFADLDEAVRAATRRVREHPYLPHRDRVRGFVYDVDTGHVREVIV